MSSSRFLNPITPGGLLTQIQGALTSDEALVVQSIASGQYFYFNEVPTGVINGSNPTFTLSHAPNPTSSLEVYLNGVKQKLTADYSCLNTTLTMVVNPSTNDILTVNYTVSPV